MSALFIDPDYNGSFVELAVAVAGHLTAALRDVPPERPVYLLGEGFGAVLALHLAYECRRLVNRLILINPATSYPASPLARLRPLLARIPPGLLGLGGAPGAPPQLPLPRLPGLPASLPLPPPPPLPLMLAPLLGTSPQALARQMFDGVSGRQPEEAMQALRSALDAVQQIGASLPPAALVHRLGMLEEGCKLVEPRLALTPQRCMVLAGGADLALGSEEEAKRLAEKMQRAFKKVLPDAGHALLHEPGPGGDLLGLLEAEGFYTTRRAFSSRVRPGADVNAFGTAGPVEVPNQEEVARYAADWTGRIRQLSSPMFLSTLPDGSRVRGLDGLPDRRDGRGGDGHAHRATAASHQDNGGSSLRSGGLDAAHGGGVGAGGLPAGPLLFVGNHQLYAFDMSVMVEEVLRERGILMRGLAHPGLFRRGAEGEEEGGGGGSSGSGAAGGNGNGSASSGSNGSNGGASSNSGSPGGNGGNGGDGDALPPAFMGNMFQSFGSVRVSPTAMYRLMAAGEAVLLYPGGVREGFKRRNEKYELFWPARSEFVRMAARFGATIIPVSAVGLEDSLAMVLDSDEIRASPLWSARMRDQAAAAPRARVGVAEDAALDESFIPPLIAPATPARMYFLFGRPVRVGPELYRDRAACDQVYAGVKAEVEGGIAYLLRKREQDPYRDFVRRMLHEQNPPFGPRRTAPTFKL